MKEPRKKYYAVIRDDLIGIFTKWKSAEPYTIGHKCKQKSFPSYRDAMKYIRAGVQPSEHASFSIDRGRNIAYDTAWVRRSPTVDWPSTSM